MIPARVFTYTVLLLAFQIAACSGGGGGGGGGAGGRFAGRGETPTPATAPTATPRPPVGAAPTEAAPTPTPVAGLSSDCQNPSGYTPLSRCGSGDITIGSGSKSCSGGVYLDKNVTLGNITIASGGTLLVSDQAAQGGIQLTTTGIDVQNGGTLQIGNSKCPIGTSNASNKATVKFTGLHPANCGDVTKGPGYIQCQGYEKGIQIESGGSFYMYGLKGVPAPGDTTHTMDWTYLAQPAGPASYNAAAGVKAPSKGADAITVAGDITNGGSNRGWKAGDWIAVATTSFSPWETEFVQIKDNPTYDKTSNTTSIKLAQPLVYYHFGGPDPYAKDGGVPGPNSYNADASTNYGVDERAEVGLISRNILLTSDADTVPGPKGQPNENSHWGGETRTLQGFKAFVMQGVQLQKFGKETLGAYPIHFHMDGNLAQYTPTLLVDSNSVDHSYNKCITVHSTYTTDPTAYPIVFSNNVCARITGHIFYEEVGDEQNITFRDDLGMGAMSNSFTINNGSTDDKGNPVSAATLIAKYYWTGDNLNNMVYAVGNSPGKLPFDQFDIFDPDNQQNPVTGVCMRPQGPEAGGANGTLTFQAVAGSCKPPNIYFEPPTGFWIITPSTRLMGNSIAGCQDIGMAYWYVTPTKGGVPESILNDKYIPIGANYTGTHGVFINNRAHGCYGGLYSDSNVVVSGQLRPYLNGVNVNPQSKVPNPKVVDEFDQFTASRIRWRALWVRPEFNVVNQSRFATNRRSLSFVTSGGTDGNYPGVWALLKDSVVVGVSTNNVDRFGPCATNIPAVGLQTRGGERGCIDATSFSAADKPYHSGVYLADGYPTPKWNLFGFQIYDGPPLIIHDHFVNFLQNPGPLLTNVDKTTETTTCTPSVTTNCWIYPIPYKRYEGDAAFGWLEGNQSAYPTAATTDQLSWTNVNFRHQVYTADVKQADFFDGDKNTAVIDEDGSLSGLQVGDANGNPVANTFPISLNDLPFNNTTNTSGGMPANSAAECHATGQQNIDVENGRPTALMSPGSMGQLEFEALFPYPADNPPGYNYTQMLTFYKDNLDFGKHGSMDLKSRNGLGIWEPKVISGYGYVVRADPYVYPPGLNPPKSPAGIPKNVDVTIDDVVKPNISTKPFYMQLGICYTGANELPPVIEGAQPFTITRGYRSYGNGVENRDAQLAKYWIQFDGSFLGVLQSALAKNICFNLDSQVPGDVNCPAQGLVFAATAAGCPKGTTAVQAKDTSVTPQPYMCLYPKSTVEKADSLADMTTDGKLNGPPNLNKYYYDASTGMLYVWIYQDQPNLQAPSPLGNCTGNPATDPYFCPSNTTGESYYVCPKEGCSTLHITLNSSTYIPGPSNCAVFGPGGTAADWTKNTAGATWPGPPTTDQNYLVYTGTKTIVQTQAMNASGQFPYNATTQPLSCPTTSPTPAPTPVP